MRPLAIAIGLLLAGAALACSGRVPPPGATLSGSVWVDGNANGVRDKCDAGRVRASLYVQLTATDAAPLEVRVDTDGAFSFSKVPPGEYTLSIRQSQGFQWPVTAPTDTETHGAYALRLQGYEEAGGFDFGVATDTPMTLYPTGFGLIAVVFNDKDGDGEIGLDECALQAEGVGVSVGQAESALPSGENAVYEFEDLRQVPDSVRPVYWPGKAPSTMYLPTQLDLEGCPRAAPANPIPGSRLYQAAIGMQRIEGTASVSVSVFVDFDEDGVRDEGERDFRLPISLTGRCSDGPETAPSGRENGLYKFTSVPAGFWRLRADAFFPLGDVDVTTSTEIYVQEHGVVQVDLGVNFPHAGYIQVVVVSDDNLNGSPDPGEPLIPGAQVCYAGPYHIEGPDCVRAADGTVLVGPLTLDSYDVGARPGGVPSHFPPFDATVNVLEDEIASITIAVAP